MRALIWSLRLLVFLVLFAFAAKNTEPVTLRFFLGTTWQVPLIVLLFAFFAIGAVVGVLAMTAPYVRQWREKRRLVSIQHAPPPPPVMPPLDAER
ncbi:MAG TPA: LapA family protein [Rhodocyclaceae bacterium]|nr:LapA family protein [Rhodocyclaceae bacterium]